MKVLVTGVNGQLGYDVINELHRRGITAIGSDITEAYAGIQDESAVTEAPYVRLDITDRNAVINTILSLRPNAVIHCAAWTAVDLAEEENNKERVFSINASGTENIAIAVKEVDAKMVYISTDYVFNGQGTEPWKADSNCYSPCNVYGWSKLKGECAVSSIVKKYYIVRTAWVFGVNGNNFIKTMLRIGERQDYVTVVDDQIGTPTYTEDLAKLLADMIVTDKYGYYHATNSEDYRGGYISWADFAEKIFEVAGYETGVKRVSTEEYGRSKALRPYNSRLDKTKLEINGFAALPSWIDATERYIAKLKGGCIL